MSFGIRATVEFDSVDVCPIVKHSGVAETTIDSVTQTVCSDGCTECVTEFSSDADDVPTDDFTPTFSHGSTQRYRLTHEGEASCPCEHLGEFGCPVSRYVAEEGTLTTVFHAVDYDRLQAIIGALRDQFPNMGIKRLVRSPRGTHTRDSVLIDRSKLTERQLEVLETAHEMGYFERSRQTNATDIADELDISPSTFREHLAAAESKIFEDVL